MAERPGGASPAAIPNAALVLDLLAWIAARPRPHAEVMEAWRTSCPRPTIWEDALDLGLLCRHPGGMVEITETGRRLLEAAGRPGARP